MVGCHFWRLPQLGPDARGVELGLGPGLAMRHGLRAARYLVLFAWEALDLIRPKLRELARANGSTLELARVVEVQGREIGFDVETQTWCEAPGRLPATPGFES